jgi:hypothetical protein
MTLLDPSGLSRWNPLDPTVGEPSYTINVALTNLTSIVQNGTSVVGSSLGVAAAVVAYDPVGAAGGLISTLNSLDKAFGATADLVTGSEPGTEKGPYRSIIYSASPQNYEKIDNAIQLAETASAIYSVGGAISSLPKLSNNFNTALTLQRNATIMGLPQASQFGLYAAKYGVLEPLAFLKDLTDASSGIRAAPKQLESLLGTVNPVSTCQNGGGAW